MRPCRQWVGMMDYGNDLDSHSIQWEPLQIWVRDLTMKSECTSPRTICRGGWRLHGTPAVKEVAVMWCAPEVGGGGMRHDKGRAHRFAHRYGCKVREKGRVKVTLSPWRKVALSWVGLRESSSAWGRTLRCYPGRQLEAKPPGVAGTGIAFLSPKSHAQSSHGKRL